MGVTILAQKKKSHLLGYPLFIDHGLINHGLPLHGTFWNHQQEPKETGAALYSVASMAVRGHHNGGNSLVPDVPKDHRSLPWQFLLIIHEVQYISRSSNWPWLIVPITELDTFLQTWAEPQLSLFSLGSSFLTPQSLADLVLRKKSHRASLEEAASCGTWAENRGTVITYFWYPLVH